MFFVQFVEWPAFAVAAALKVVACAEDFGTGEAFLIGFEADVAAFAARVDGEFDGLLASIDEPEFFDASEEVFLGKSLCVLADRAIADDLNNQIGRALDFDKAVGFFGRSFHKSHKPFVNYGVRQEYYIGFDG